MTEDGSSTSTISLKPPETIQRILLSTTSRLFGEFADHEVLVTHAWPGMGDQNAPHRWSEGPMSRSAYVLSFVTEKRIRDVGVVVPDYSATGDRLAGSMSVLFGKRFDNHGSLQNMGSFGLPDMTAFSFAANARLPHNSHSPRSDVPVPLNLVEMRRLNPFWVADHQDQTSVQAFLAASEFYLRSLQAFEQDSEVAYLHLITAGEIVSNAMFPARERLLDADMERLVSQIEGAMPDGPSIGRILRKRMFEVKRRYVATFVDLVDQEFFGRREAEDQVSALSRDSFEKRISAAYQLRSLYLHSGQSFGGWIRPLRGNNEIQLGRPIVDDKEMRKALEWAPTLIGLERVTRYMLLKFMEARLDVDLAISPPPSERVSPA